jgi:adenosylcobyric acid synthase
MTANREKKKKAHTLMVQGTSSFSGKTTFVAALCRIFANDGYRVAPFKAQNMSLNSYVTKDGLEISRAQVLQALACRLDPSSDMNPILLKPKGNEVAQIILNGKPLQEISAKGYYRQFALGKGITNVSEALDRLRQSYDIVVIEGAGSAVEPNLYDQDIANMRIADLADSPVVLVADIDRGGAFASILGTLQILRPEHRERVKGIAINKFRGDLGILQPALDYVERESGKPVLGVVPYLEEERIGRLPSEDSLSIPKGSHSSKRLPPSALDVAVIRLPRISNFTDMEALSIERSLGVRYVENVQELGSPDIIILPGTKNTVGDLQWLFKTGLAKEISEKVEHHGTPILGICGGYQMLGREIYDPLGIEGDKKRAKYPGLGFLGVVSRFEKYEKVTRLVKAEVVCESPMLKGAKGIAVEGYEIHMGGTVLDASSSPTFKVWRKAEKGKRKSYYFDGASSPNGLVIGTSLHGVFEDPTLRSALVGYLLSRRNNHKRASAASSNTVDSKTLWDSGLDRLAKVFREHIDMQSIYRIAGLH